jgi:hypothetical protein
VTVAVFGFTVTCTTGAALTVSVAASLVTVPAEFVTTTANFDPLSVDVAAGVV